jgi:hypothetical protein
LIKKLRVHQEEVILPFAKVFWLKRTKRYSITHISSNRIRNRIYQRIKKDPDIAQSALSNKGKAVIIDVLKNEYSLWALLDEIQLSTSSYY